MIIFSESLIFQWDQGNLDKNFFKHKVTCQEAEEVFYNQPLILSEDAKHSKIELRYYVLGKTNNDRLLFISFTRRQEKIRIISARDMNKKEEKIYEKI